MDGWWLALREWAGAIDALALLTNHLQWLRVLVLPTVSRTEVIFAAPLFVALSAALWSMWVMGQRVVIALDATRRFSAGNGGSVLTAKESRRRARARLFRLSVWAVVVVGLMADWRYATLVFTYGAMLYPIIEMVDAILEVAFLVRIENYHEQKEAEARARRALEGQSGPIPPYGAQDKAR